MTALVREVHVWSASIAAHAPNEARYWSLLDAPEQAKAERLSFSRDRTIYVVSHGWLRTLLGRYLRRPPATLGFTAGTWGKPALDQPSGGAGLTFNLSHSGDYALIALARDRAVGIDVERWGLDIDYDRLAAICFSRAERAELAALAPAQKVAAFHTGWTRKEAYVKALGVGVSQGLDYFDVSLAPALPTRIIDDRLNGVLLPWRLTDVPMEAGYSAALCAAGSDWSVRRFAATPAVA